MDALLKPFKAFFGWPAAVFYEVRHGQEDLDILYPDRRQATVRRRSPTRPSPATCRQVPACTDVPGFRPA